HEYAHFLMHASGKRLPAWLDEGLAEFYSTARIGQKGCSIGGELAGHSEALRRRWIPLQELFSTPSDAALEVDKKHVGIFYAQSWLLAHMLVLSPAYKGEFQAFIHALNSGTSSEQALTAVYGKSVDAVDRDARAWAARTRFTAVSLPGVATESSAVEVFELTLTASRLMLAEVVLGGGQLDRAE